MPLVGIAEHSLQSSKTVLYPNPVSSVFTIRFSDNVLDGRTLKYELYDALGKVADENFITVTDKHIVLSRNNVNTGIYTYKLILNSNIISTGKISVE